MQADPITIHLENAGKKFGREWIFRRVNLELTPGDKAVILGLNGSGKSTLLQAMSGYLSLNEGVVHYIAGAKGKIEAEKQYMHTSLASPYLELIEDFTLEEMIAHAGIYKSYLKGLSQRDVLELSGLEDHRHKHIRIFSSGMKQRVKLVLAILADAPVLLLDEPTTNLDASVIGWYNEMIGRYAMQKTIVVASNSIEHEYAFCTRRIQMSDYKP